jgi:hypothetical protein
MTTDLSLPGESLAGLRFWQEEGRWLYLPERPQPLRGPSGRAQLSVIQAGGVTMVAIGVTLQPASETLEQLRQEVRRRGGLAETLVPAPLSVKRAALLVAEDGGFAEVASAHPSDLPPQAAAYSAVLRDAHGATAAAAGRGEHGKLRVLYAVELPRRRAATARLAGDLGGHAGDIAAPPDVAAATAIRCAAAAGDLAWTETADSGASEALRAAARDAALAQAVESLARTGSDRPGGRAGGVAGRGDAHRTGAARPRARSGCRRLAGPMSSGWQTNPLHHGRTWRC